MNEHDDDDKLALWVYLLLLMGAVGGAIVWIAGQSDGAQQATVTGHVEDVGAAESEPDVADDPPTTTTIIEAADPAYTIDIGVDAGTNGSPVTATLTGQVASDAASDEAEQDAVGVFGTVDNQLDVVTDGTISSGDAAVTITGSASQTVLDAAEAFYGGDAAQNELTVSEVAAAEEADALVGDLNDLFQLDPIQFDSGSATVQQQSLPTIDAAADALRSVSDGSLTIEGHTDDQGGDETNLALSQARAESVLDSLVDAGVDSARLTAVGFGEAQPIADNTTAEGRQLNRRIEFRVDEV